MCLSRFVALQRRQLLRKLDGADQAVCRSHTLAGDIECRAMVYRRPYDGQTQRDIHSSFEIEQFRWDMTLIVIHAHDRVELLSPHGEIEQRVRREGPLDGIALLLRPLHRGDDLADLLVSEGPVLSGVGI